MRRCALFVIIAAVTTSAQESPRFDISSIKRSAPGGRSTTYGTTQPGGRWIAINATLREMLIPVLPSTGAAREIVGGPVWIDTNRFDVTGIAGSERPPGELQQMMLSLLRERFGLKTHTEPRQMQGFELVSARSDGRLGERLKPSSCTAASPCRRPLTGGNAGVSSDPAPISLVVAIVENRLRVPVIDRTGLTGSWSIDLAYDSATITDPGAPGLTIFNALEDQLGLKLQKTQVTRDVLVIDAASPPTEN